MCQGAEAAQPLLRSDGAVAAECGATPEWHLAYHGAPGRHPDPLARAEPARKEQVARRRVYYDLGGEAEQELMPALAHPVRGDHSGRRPELCNFATSSFSNSQGGLHQFTS